MLRYHQTQKQLTGEDLFAAIDTSKDDKIDAAEFAAFFKTCEKEPIKKQTKETKETKEGEQKEDEKKEAEGDAMKEEGVEAEVAVTQAPSEEDLARLFEHLDGENEGLSKEKFCSLVRVYMKVARDTVMTSDLSIKDSKTLRRLEVGEIVEVLAGPMKEGTVDVLRVRCKAMKDDLEGFTTLMGNQGSKFLEEGGSVWKVAGETILTQAFELDVADKDAKPRKMKVGELVEVREWARKEEKSGLMRMKCRCKADGAVGFVTTVGNQGTVFMQAV